MASLYLYGATFEDRLAALWTASVRGVAADHVTGDYCTALNWAQHAGTTSIVIAVGVTAANNLYYCGGCAYTDGPVDSGVSDSTFENAAGSTGQDSFLLANGLVYYAQTGALPYPLPYPLPAQVDIAADGGSCSGLAC